MLPHARRSDPATASRDHGAVFTRRWVVDLVLDLAGYAEDSLLSSCIALEPSCGDGAFLVPMVERLSASCRIHGIDIGEATPAIVAFDLQADCVSRSREAVGQRLIELGWGRGTSRTLAETWIRQGDFLLDTPWDKAADFVLGNPPYIRLEAVPDSLSNAYRRACPTMGGRADIYVGFIEKGLRVLKPDGVLGYICADRWMRNQYGQDLRRLVSSGYSVESVVQMHDVDAFENEVSAYPAITVIRRGEQGSATVVEATAGFDEGSADRVRNWLTAGKRSRDNGTFHAIKLTSWFDGDASWPSASPERLALLQDLESRLPSLQDEATGTKVGIGVATGADKVFVTKDPRLVEVDRLLPLAMAGDTASGHLDWSGHYLVDPWDGDTGDLVELSKYPRMRKYFEDRSEHLLGRNVAGRQPKRWYRTIDRVDHSLTRKSKLLIPDIKERLYPTLDRGEYYPHHNLYWVASRDWDIEVLGGLLLSRVANMFVEAYSVRMRGGHLRFQSQYLRRIRVPSIDAVDKKTAAGLARAHATHDVELATIWALKAYGLDSLPA
jgi:hypothetical protein